MKVTNEMIEAGAKAIWEMRDRRDGGSLTWEEVIANQYTHPHTYYTAVQSRSESDACLSAALQSAAETPAPQTHVAGITDEMVIAACRAHTPQFDRLDPVIAEYAIQQMRAGLLAAFNLPGGQRDRDVYGSHLDGSPVYEVDR